MQVTDCTRMVPCQTHCFHAAWKCKTAVLRCCVFSRFLSHLAGLPRVDMGAASTRPIWQGFLPDAASCLLCFSTTGIIWHMVIQASLSGPPLRGPACMIVLCLL